MKKELFLFFICTVFFMCANTAHAGQLRLITDDTTYSNASSDPWFHEGFVTEKTDFTLNLVNTFTNKTIQDAKLVLAVPYAVDPGSWSIQIGSDTYDYTYFSTAHSGSHPYLTGNNGIYQNAFWVEYSVGNLAEYDHLLGGADTVSLNVKIANAPAGFLLHFDGYGSTSNPGRVFVPYSEDLTVKTAPEPVSASLFFLGTGVFVARRMKRKVETK